MSRRTRAVEAFLLELVHVDADRPSLLARSTGLPVTNVVREATEHGVLALLAEAAQLHPSAWPSLTQATAPQWSGHLAWTMRMLVDLQEVTETLEQACIPHAVLKGPVLAGPLYGDPYLRGSSDLDLLVPRKRRAEVAAALRLGQLSATFEEADAADSGQISALLPRGTPLDLHWELVNDPAARRETGLDTAAVLSRRRFVDVRGVPTSTLDTEDTVLHLVSHALVSGGHRLVWYVDLDRALRDPHLDLTVLAQRAADARLGTGLTVLTRRCHRYLGTPTGVHVSTSRAWSALSPLAALGPPSGGNNRLSRGQLFFRATRQDTRSSLRALAGVTREALGHKETSVRSVALISLEPWDATWRRNQHLVSQLVAQDLLERVVFVEPPSPGRGRGRWSPALGIDVLRPSLFVPKRVGGLALVGWWLRLTALQGVDLVWVNDPDLGSHCLKPRAVYDVTDDWRTFRQAPRVMRRLLAAEDRLARRARTIVCSQVLADRWRKRYAVDAAVLHNGIDVAAFTTAQPRPLTGLGPHLGYVGTLHAERLDLPLVADLAQIGTVHLVGPSSLTPQEESRLREAGVVLHGPVPSEEVASWMTSMDVLVSPHLVSDFTLSLDAIKSYEYLATGLPVVATPSSGFQLLTAPQLRVAPREDFASGVVEMATGERFAPLLDSGWDRRAQQMSRLL